MDFATIKALVVKNVKKGIEGCQKISLNAMTSFKNNPSTPILLLFCISKGVSLSALHANKSQIGFETKANWINQTFTLLN